MGRKLTISLTAAAVVVLALVLLAEPALADPVTQTDPKQTGDHFGDLIRDIFTPIVLTVGGVIGIAAIVKRDYLLALALVGVTVIVLGFLIQPSPYQTWGKEVLNSVFGAGAVIGVR